VICSYCRYEFSGQEKAGAGRQCRQLRARGSGGQGWSEVQGEGLWAGGREKEAAGTGSKENEKVRTRVWCRSKIYCGSRSGTVKLFSLVFRISVPGPPIYKFRFRTSPGAGVE
jgi:hypothetical protein